MSWNVVPNCHVRIWKNGVLPPGPPLGPATYDGPGQLLVPYMVSGLPSPWRHRLALLPTALTITSADINALGTQCWVQIRDDSAPAVWNWWKIVDMSTSPQPDPMVPGNFKLTAVFFALVLSQ